MLAALLLAGLSITAQAQQTPANPPTHDKKKDDSTANSSAPPADTMPHGDPKSGVLKPPDVDPKMAKTVPDVDPAMDNPPPGKVPAPDDSDPPKVQPR